jgi:hypothetical protein
MCLVFGRSLGGGTGIDTDVLLPLCFVGDGGTAGVLFESSNRSWWLSTNPAISLDPSKSRTFELRIKIVHEIAQQIQNPAVLAL